MLLEKIRGVLEVRLPLLERETRSTFSVVPVEKKGRKEGRKEGRERQRETEIKTERRIEDRRMGGQGQKDGSTEEGKERDIAFM